MERSTPISATYRLQFNKNFTFRDATGLLGHKSKSMTERYLRDREIPTVDGPSFGQVLDVGQKGTKN